MNGTVICAFPAVTEPIVGASGATSGVTVLDAVDDEEVPALLVAVTVNEYEVPFESP